MRAWRETYFRKHGIEARDRARRQRHRRRRLLRRPHSARYRSRDREGREGHYCGCRTRPALAARARLPCRLPPVRAGAGARRDLSDAMNFGPEPGQPHQRWRIDRHDARLARRAGRLCPPACRRLGRDEVAFGRRWPGARRSSAGATLPGRERRSPGRQNGTSAHARRSPRAVTLAQIDRYGDRHRSADRARADTHSRHVAPQASTNPLSSSEADPSPGMRPSDFFSAFQRTGVNPAAFRPFRAEPHRRRFGQKVYDQAEQTTAASATTKRDRVRRA